MKKTILYFFVLILSLPSFAQDLTGRWNGMLKFPSAQLRVVFNISELDGKYSSTMDSPDQRAKGLPVESTLVFGGVVTLKMPNLSAEYFGVYNNKTKIIEGTFKQMGHDIQLNLQRDEIVVEKVKRSQEPSSPFPYNSEDVNFYNSIDKITLAGTITTPKTAGKFPVVVLISGSGPQNRDEEILGHKPFLVIADYLSRNGIAVLRFDDRGVGMSKGSFASATTEDFASDVEAAISYLKTRKDIDYKNIGLMGHSEGGIIAPMLASKSDDIAFVILLAAPAIEGERLLNLQSEAIARVSNVDSESIKASQELNSQIFKIVKTAKDDKKACDSIKELIRQSILSSPNANTVSQDKIEELANQKANTVLSPWFRFFLTYDPVPALMKTHCPVLALNGDKDTQVPAKENLIAIENALKKAGNKNYKIIKLESQNHLFQVCKTGSPSEYSAIDETFSPISLKIIGDWIKNIVND